MFSNEKRHCQLSCATGPTKDHRVSEKCQTTLLHGPMKIRKAISTGYQIPKKSTQMQQVKENAKVADDGDLTSQKYHRVPPTLDSVRLERNSTVELKQLKLQNFFEPAKKSKRTYDDYDGSCESD